MNNMATNFKNDILMPMLYVISYSCTHIDNASDKVLHLFRVSILYIISSFLEELGIHRIVLNPLAGRARVNPAI